MSAEIHVLPPEQSPERALVVRLPPRVAVRLRRRAKDCRLKPAELAALLLEKILNPQEAGS